MKEKLRYTLAFILIVFFTISCSMPEKNDISERIDNNENVEIINENVEDNSFSDNLDIDNSLIESLKDSLKSEEDKLYEAYKESKRVNVLVLGVEKDPRSDVIILVSFDTKSKKVDMISIPRDTYYKVDRYNSGDHRKINAAYARKREEGSIEAVKDILLDIPIHHYVTVKYSGVEKIVNAMGGVEIYVPKRIGDIPKGKQNLNGEQAVKYLRYRKGYNNGDLGRVSAQQEFIKAATKKSLSLKLPKVIKETYSAVKTDMSIGDILKYSLKGIKVNPEDIIIKTLPGTAGYRTVGGKGWSYFFHDSDKTKELIYDIYDIDE